MLDVEGREDVDAGDEQFLDILPALQMTRIGRVGVRKFIDHGNPGMAGEHRFQIQFGQLRAVIGGHLAGNHWQSLQQKLGFLAAMGLDQCDGHVDTLVVGFARRLQHRVGLAHARRHAEEDLQPAARRLCLGLLERGQQGVGVGSVGVRHSGKEDEGKTGEPQARVAGRLGPRRLPLSGGLRRTSSTKRPGCSQS